MPFTKTVKQSGKKDGRNSTDFLLLFFVLLCGNCFLAVYYCFEQWLEAVSVTPNWRGLLLGILYGMVMVTRPAVSLFMLSRSKLPAIAISLIVSMLILMSYQFLPSGSPLFVWMVLVLRIVQGFFLAVFSSCVVAAIVRSFPRGARPKDGLSTPWLTSCPMRPFPPLEKNSCRSLAAYPDYLPSWDSSAFPRFSSPSSRHLI